MDPWFCNGCIGSVGTPAHGGAASFLADDRMHRWAGPHQQIQPTTVDSLSQLNLAFNYSIYSETEDLTEYIWKIAVTKNEELRYFDLQHGKVVAGSWKDDFTFITLPSFVREAQSIDFYLEAFPETAAFRIDDVALYDQDASNWEDEANGRIDLLRKRNLNIAFDFLDSDISENLRLQVTQKTHQFGFGSAVKSIEISNCLTGGSDSSYCTFAKENFNFMTDTYRMKWPEQEPQEGQLNIDSIEVTNNFIQWASQNGMQVRGHSLLWSRGQNNPGWVAGLQGEELVRAMEQRVDTAVTMYEGLVPHWDVINEMINNDFYISGTGEPNIRIDMFNRAKTLSPETRLFVNEYGVLLDKYGRFQAFQELLRSLLDGGAEIDAIGLQGHITEDDLAEVTTIKLHLDQLWSEFHLPIWITEFTFNVGGEISDPDHSIYAEQLENFYRLAFSHEAVEGIVMWQFEHSGSQEGSSLVGPDMELNQAGKAYSKLYHQEWRSSQTLTPTLIQEQEAQFSFRGFKGDYDLILEDGDEILYFGSYTLVEDSELTCTQDVDKFDCNF